MPESPLGKSPDKSINGHSLEVRKRHGLRVALLKAKTTTVETFRRTVPLEKIDTLTVAIAIQGAIKNGNQIFTEGRLERLMGHGLSDTDTKAMVCAKIGSRINYLRGFGAVIIEEDGTNPVFSVNRGLLGEAITILTARKVKGGESDPETRDRLPVQRLTTEPVKR